MQRRNFLWASALGAGLTVLPHSVSSAVAADLPGDQRSKAKLRFCSHLGMIPGANDEEKMKNMKNWGFEAVELGRLGSDADVDLWKKKIADAGLLMSTTCWGSQNGDLCSEDLAKRQPGIDALKEQLVRNGKLGGTGVIYVPAFNGQTKLTNQEIHKLLLEFLPEVGKFAVECGTKVVLEPLNRREAFFLRQVSDGARIAMECNKIAGCDGIATMGDFYHMYHEEANDMGAFISGGHLIQHVHFGNGPKRTLPGQEVHSFVQGFRGLKYIGYNNFMSFECGVAGDDKEAEIRKSLDFLRSEWEKA